MAVTSNDLKHLLSPTFTEGNGVWLKMTTWVSVLKA